MDLRLVSKLKHGLVKLLTFRVVWHGFWPPMPSEREGAHWSVCHWSVMVASSSLDKSPGLTNALHDCQVS